MVKVLLAVLALAGVYILLQYNLTKPVSPPAAVQPNQVESAELENQEVHSPDGKMNLIMKTISNKDNTNTFSFFTSEISENSEYLILSKSLGPSGRMEIPQNAWSPDNKLIFINENKDGVLDWFVFKHDGTAFSNGKNFLDVQEVFIARKSDYYITDVTGWAGPNLLLVKTAFDKNTKGPIYWFETTSQKFIQLADR